MGAVLNNPHFATTGSDVAFAGKGPLSDIEVRGSLDCEESSS